MVLDGTFHESYGRGSISSVPKKRIKLIIIQDSLSEASLNTRLNLYISAPYASRE